MSNDEFCQNCRFWCPQSKFRKNQRYATDLNEDVNIPRLAGGRKDAKKGLCRRHAPQTSALTTSWMETTSGDWCGDYEHTDET